MQKKTNYDLNPKYFLLAIAELQTICKEYWNKIARLESDKYDLEVIEQFKNLEVTGIPHAAIIRFYLFIIIFFILKKLIFSNLILKSNFYLVKI